MADETNEAAAAKRLADERVLTERSRQEFADRMRGRPTPTQEENDLAACGQHFHEHSDDGSGPDPHSRHLEPGTGAPYQTRQSTAGRAAPPRPSRAE